MPEHSRRSGRHTKTLRPLAPIQEHIASLCGQTSEYITELEEERDNLITERKGIRDEYWRLVEQLDDWLRQPLDAETKVKDCLGAVQLSQVITARYNNPKYDKPEGA